MPHQQLRILIHPNHISATQKSTRGAYHKRFPASWDGVAALLRWVQDIMQQGSSITIDATDDTPSTLTTHLKTKLKSLTCINGSRCNFTVLS